MTSFGYRLNPRYAIKECLSCGALYTKECTCSKGSVEDKILVSKPPKNYAMCAKCGHPVSGPYCQGCSLLREKLEEDLVTYLKYFQDTSELSDDSTNVVNAPREPVVVKQDHGVNPPHIDECCCECGNALDGIYCQQCICKYCGKGAYIGHNCPPKVSIISNPEPSNAQYGHYCTPQAPFNNLEPGYSQDLNFPQNIHNFQQQYLCCDQCGGPHKTFQCQQVICHEPCCENCGGPHKNFQCQPVNYCEPNPSYDSYYSGFDQFGDFHQQQYPCCENCGGPHETFQCQPTNEDYYHEQNSCYNFTSQNTIMEQMTQLTSMCEMFCQIIQKKQEEKRIEEEQAAKARYWKIPACCDDDEDYDSVITLVLSAEETDNSLSMRDEHVDTIPAMESDELIKSSVEDLVPIPSEFEGIPDTMCDVHLVNNPTPLEAKDHFEIIMNSNDDISSSDDDSFYKENIEYVEASPHDSELVSLEAEEIVIPEEEEIEDNNLREKLLNVHLLIANIEALKYNPTQSSEFLTKSSSTSPKSFLEETNTFHNSLLEFENFYFDLGEINSGSTTTHSDISLPDYEAFSFDDGHIEEISSGNTTTHSDISLSEYDLFIFDFTHEEFADELAHIISPPEYDRF
nr:hypothetical protein [Tanacetum cinerariifolium]